MTSRDKGALSGSREPSPDGLGPSGFDPARWMDLYCALANARYALELWEREYTIAANRAGHVIPVHMAQWCIERGRREGETLREFETMVRPLACRDPKGFAQTPSPRGTAKGNLPVSEE